MQKDSFGAIAGAVYDHTSPRQDERGAAEWRLVKV